MGGLWRRRLSPCTYSPLLFVSSLLLCVGAGPNGDAGNKSTACSSPSLRQGWSGTDKTEVPNQENTVRVLRGSDAVLPCRAFNASLDAKISWLRGLSGELVATYHTSNPDEVEISECLPNRGSSYRMLNAQNGSLLLINARRELVGRYECIVEIGGVEGNGRNGRNGSVAERKSSTVHFRLRLSQQWFSSPTSLFWGSCISAIVFCAASFILNLIWIGVRKLALWWINRKERISRVHSMVEAIEKYRQRQMESLHDAYHRKISAIRENYHSQVEQIRVSTHQQMENVTQQFDSIRENYNQQVGRIRDYGSRRAEQLWESYERQLNRVRTFTLQQRLRLQRQYKVKQRYINKLLESIAENTNPDVIERQEAAIRAALDPEVILVPPAPLLEPSPLTAPLRAISRSSSYYSLPEFIDAEEEEAPGIAEIDLSAYHPRIQGLNRARLNNNES